MAEQPDESAIVRLLEDLVKYEARWRHDAIKTIIKSKINDQRVIDTLLQVIKNDPSKSIRNFARSALDTFGVEHSEVEKDEPLDVAPISDSKSVEHSDVEKDEFIAFTAQNLYGFVGWYLINGVIWYALMGGFSEWGYSEDPLDFINGMFTFPVNLLVYGVLRSSESTREISNGILAAVAVNFLLGLISGVFMNGICFIPFYVR